MTLKTRVQRLEAGRPMSTVAGWDRFIWSGPQDDAALRDAEAAAEAANRGLVVVRIVDAPQARDITDPSR